MAFLFGINNKPYKPFHTFLKEMGVQGDNLATIDADLQQKFFPKNDAGVPRERWDLPKIGIPCTRERFHRHLALCGFYQETIPTKWEYTYAGWPGALATRACVRLIDLISAWKAGVRWKETIVFAGKRPRIKEKETLAAITMAVAPRVWEDSDPTGLEHCETELDVMKYLFNNLKLPNDLRDIPWTFVDAPMKPPATPDGPPIRPNSEDTIKAWLEMDPKTGSLILSSGAPYGMAMDEAWSMLLEINGISVETFGHKAPDLEPEVFMREVAGCVHRIARARQGVLS